jgi:hypothetical protein
MTIGIAVTMPNAVLLVADGRKTLPLVENSLVDDNVDKITVINNNLAIISFGITQATEPALENLKSLSIDVNDMNVCVKSVKDSLDIGWNSMVSRLATDVDRSKSFMRAALVTGGLVDQTSFIAGVMHDFDVTKQPVIRSGGLNTIVLGGDKYNSDTYFETKVVTFIQNTHVSIEHFSESLFYGVLQAAGDTIRTISKYDNSVGGTIRYVLLRPSSTPIRGEWPEITKS